METIRFERALDIPVVATADVVVVGGGPGGLGAAVMAARAGARTILVERYAMLGGMATVGEVQPFMANHIPEGCLDRPVYLAWGQRMQTYLAPPHREPSQRVDQMQSGMARTINKEVAALAAEDLCLEAGVQLLYHHWLADVVKKDRRIEAVVLQSKSGLSAVRGHMFVDATGDADLAALAGCAFEYGNAQGQCQPMTLCFKVIGLELDRCQPWTEVVRLYAQARADGVLNLPRENLLAFKAYEPGVLHFNSTRVLGRNATSGLELAAAEIEGRRQLRQLLFWMRKNLRGYENVELLSMGAHIGVRESRRVCGRAYIQREDFTAARKFPDGIARVHYNIDIHNPAGGDTELVALPPGAYYEIPYGCIVPRDCDNLTIGGRPISVDHAVHSSMRIMPVACTVGQAAGLAAALGAVQGKRPADLDGVSVRQRLREMGAYL